MNTDILKGNWEEVKGEVKQRWGKLTDDDLATVNGDNQKLSGLLQKHYGYAKDDVSLILDDFKAKLNGKCGLNKAANVVNDMTETVMKKTKEVAEHLKHDAGTYGKAVVDFVEHKPVQSLALAALAGLVIGLLVKKS